MPPLTSPLSPWHSVSYCGFHVCPLHPSSSLFTHWDTRRSLPCLLSLSALPYQKGWPPLIWRSLIIPCRTGGPLIQPLLPSRSGPQCCPPPLSPMVLSSFSGCNCSTINRGGRRTRRGQGGGRRWRQREKKSKQNVIFLTMFFILCAKQAPLVSQTASI